MLKGKMSYVTKVWEHYGLYRQCIMLAMGVVALIGLACSPARAWEGRPMGPPPDMVDNQVEFLTEKLTLTPEQEAKVRPVLESASEKRHDLFQKYRWKGEDGRKELFSELQTLDEEVTSQLQPILTADQMETYKKLEEERKAMREKMKDRRRRSS